MTYFADLTDYTYIPTDYASRPGTKNVGWLSAGHAFETGEPTEEFLERLWNYCTVSVAPTRGVHGCEFCPGKDVHLAERNGNKLQLGTSEIRVFSDAGDIYAAPTLIYHYVRDHGYKPPGQFIQALMAQPTPPAAAYFHQLAQASLEWRKTSHPQAEPVPNYEPFRANQSVAQFPSDNRTELALARTPKIRLRDIALLLIGGLIAGGVAAVLTGVPIYGFTHSKFALSADFGICVYGSWIVGYQWLSQKVQWTDLRTRFAPVGKKALVVSAIGGLVIVGLIASTGALLQWAGFKIEHIPTPDILPQNWQEFPLAIFVIVIVAPIAEEVFFRGLLLDWLKQKMNVWIAAVILSVIFSLLHANPFSLGAVGWLAFSHRFLLGLAASALAIKYRSLRPSLVMHGTVNAIACITSMLSFA
jgi:membrane protease YdiL (CAAX protease family)